MKLNKLKFKVGDLIVYIYKPFSHPKKLIHYYGKITCITSGTVGIEWETKKFGSMFKITIERWINNGTMKIYREIK